ncbi:hypothetical protein CEXT_799271 [Caerostris extrusa]|uniref:Uncharacterized protein n=1 Tax=Caerostris extrusa TaxID=172846 RepID=A0AAV4XZG5_CAEEX|nr:hypothetical protein CEXT_799271 [Caerostris extrusa]
MKAVAKFRFVTGQDCLASHLHRINGLEDLCCRHCNFQTLMNCAYLQRCPAPSASSFCGSIIGWLGAEWVHRLSSVAICYFILFGSAWLQLCLLYPHPTGNKEKKKLKTTMVQKVCIVNSREQCTTFAP